MHDLWPPSHLDASIPPTRRPRPNNEQRQRSRRCRGRRGVVRSPNMDRGQGAMPPSKLPIKLGERLDNTVSCVFYFTCRNKVGMCAHLTPVPDKDFVVYSWRTQLHGVTTESLKWSPMLLQQTTEARMPKKMYRSDFFNDCSF